MANLVDQILAQSRAGSAQGEGFGSFAMQGAQLRQNQQQIILRERQLAMESELQPLRMKEAQLQLDATELKLKETKRMMALRESNLKAFDELSEVITGSVQGGTSANIDVQRSIRRTLARNPALMEDPRAQQLLKYFNDSMELELRDKAITEQENQNFIQRGIDPVTRQPFAGVDFDAKAKALGLEPSGLDSQGRTTFARPRQDATTETIIDPKTGVVTTRQIRGGSKSGQDVTTATQTRFEQAEATALQTAARARRLLPLLDAGNVGPRGMLTRTAEALAGTLIPDFKVGTAIEAITVSRQFKAGLIDMLKSDSNISEPERKNIEGALPQPEKLITSSNQEKLKLAATLEDVGQLSRNNAKTRGKPINPVWLMPSEIEAQFKAGTITETEAKQLLDGNMWIFIRDVRLNAEAP